MPKGLQLLFGGLQGFGELQRGSGGGMKFLDFLALQHELHLLLCECLVFDKRLGQELQFVALLGQDLGGSVTGFLNESAHFPLNLLFGFRRQAVVVCREIDVAEFLGISESGNQSEGRLSGALNVL